MADITSIIAWVGIGALVLILLALPRPGGTKHLKPARPGVHWFWWLFWLVVFWPALIIVAIINMRRA